MRIDDDCMGGKEAGRACPDARVVRCVGCGERWEPDDTSVPGKCPACGARLPAVERCEGCPAHEIAHMRAHSPAGNLLNRVLDLDFATRHFRVDWADVSVEEAWGLKILHEEREKWLEERRERERDEQALAFPRLPMRRIK